MKTLFLFLSAVLIFISCNRNDEIEQLKSQIDSLKQNSYKPGFGSFMSNIQVHHAKLWFAGTNENWQLAEYEAHELTENVEAIPKFRPDRKESQLVIMLYTVLDSVKLSIQQKNPELFKISYASLTNTCNNCHKQVNYGFNNVKIPDTPPFTNQVFKADNK